MDGYDNPLIKAAEMASQSSIVCDRFVDMLLMEYKHKIRNGIYGFTSRTMAYNSNRIEGSKLSEEQTSNLFDTGSVFGNDIYRAHDIEEMQGHFAMFNHMLDTINLPLSLDMIKEFHKKLKQCVFEDIANGYAIGNWKTRSNIVGNIKTSSPDNVQWDMYNLLQDYGNSYKTLPKLLMFHAEYETIHPFQDGNGRTGRIILFRECIRNGIEPFIIRDENKPEYIKCLTEIRSGNATSFIQYVRKEQAWFAEQTKGMF